MTALDDSLPQILPAPSPLQRLAHQAMMIELRDFDWMNLDIATTRKIHALLPCDHD